MQEPHKLLYTRRTTKTTASAVFIPNRYAVSSPHHKEYDENHTSGSRTSAVGQRLKNPFHREDYLAMVHKRSSQHRPCLRRVCQNFLTIMSTYSCSFPPCLVLVFGPKSPRVRKYLKLLCRMDYSIIPSWL